MQRLHAMFVAVLLALIAAALPVSAASARSSCAAHIPLDLPLARIGDAALDRNCDDNISMVGTRRIAVLLGEASTPDDVMESYNGYFDRLTLVAVDDGQVVASTRHDPSTIPAQTLERSFTVPLPAQPNAGRIFYAVYDNPEFPNTVTNSQLVTVSIDNSASANRDRVLIALMAGFLLLPVILNFALYRALKTRFLLWHSGMAFCMSWHLLSGGLLSVFTPLSVTAMTTLSLVSFSAVSACALIFASRFIEPEKLSPRLRRYLVVGALYLLVITAVRVARFDAIEPYSAKLYFAAFIPLLILVAFFVIDAISRGSRAIWFQLVAWSPFFLLGVVRLLTMLSAEYAYLAMPWLFMVGAVFEVIITMLGVVDRVGAIKSQRDVVQVKAETLKALSEQDALTGLLNRRVIDTRFTDLRSQGFNTFALIDLDHFKEINDHYGHHKGDAVLIAIANALQSEPGRDSIAIRLGGEEFVILLRGEDTVQRAEALRQSIPLRVARDVPELGRPVTASMGVLELSRSPGDTMSLTALYERADQLLYEAKESGRNRMAYERLTVFNEAPVPRTQIRRGAA